MLTVVVASTNPVKVQAATDGFRRMFPDIQLDVIAAEAHSAVPRQPRSTAETLTGALNRAANAMTSQPHADYWVGIEGGVQDDGLEMTAFAWVVVRSKTVTGKACTASFVLPAAVAELVRQGKELGEADDIVFHQSNSKQANGAVGLLTGDVIDRAQLYEQAVILALIPFKNSARYPMR
jgi:inosine/xanthosine triphosphatase